MTPRSGKDPSAAPLKTAVISGGSSGIGLACARELLQRGYRVVLVARDPERLNDAQATLTARHGGLVRVVPADVADAEAVQRAIASVEASEGRIDWLITAAGMVEPGLFLDLDAAAHRDQMETNYFGTVNLVRAALPLMRRHGGRITLVSSGAAFVGIAGYSGYAPGKFAVRALAEILRLELTRERITVSVAVPPDTDTPQLRNERPKRPAITRLIAEKGGVMTAERVAKRMIASAEAGAFLLAPSRTLMLLSWFHSLYRPILAWQQRRLLSRDIHDEGQQ